MSVGLMHDWSGPMAARFELNDDTLRDGLQSPSVRDPTLDEKAELVRLQAALGIETVGIGLPAASPRAALHARGLAKLVVEEALGVDVNCAARTDPRDLVPIAEIGEQTGLMPEAYVFIGASPIRRFAEGWDLDDVRRCIDRALDFARRSEIRAALVLEDTVRSHPDDIGPLIDAGLRGGARRVVLCDTVGSATPRGVSRLVAWARARVGPDLALDWHGHSDRGLALANSLAAVEAGVDRVHGTGLGIGERCGNAAVDQLLVHRALEGGVSPQVKALPRYCAWVSRILDVPVPAQYPVFGADAFRTGTGVHAAAIAKAEAKGLHEVADRVYSGVPASWFGRKQLIEVGPMSGGANVRHWLHRHGIEADEALVQAILEEAKRARRVLEDHALLECVRRYQGESLPCRPVRGITAKV